MEKRILVLTFWIMTVLIYAQNKEISIKVPSVMPSSPTASAMAKQVSSSVNYSKGLLDISISLYTIQSGELTLPITLSYDHAGLKPQESSGRIATGWLLNAEPSIMRNVQGLPDEVDYTNQTGYFYTQKGYKDNKYLFENKADLQPDEFYYKTINSGGRFYTNKSNSFTCYPNREDIIIGGNGLSQFSIIDKNGIIHTYGNATEKTIVPNYLSATTRWLCHTIQSPNNNGKIEFSYTRLNKYKYTPLKKDYIIIEDSSSIINVGSIIKNEYVNNIKSVFYIKSDGTVERNSMPEYNIYISDNFTNSYIDRYEVKTIKFDNGKVIFEYKDNIVKRISVEDKNKEIIRDIRFFSSKYNENTTLNKLDSLYIFVPGSETLVYNFSYYKAESVPSRETNDIDHWGYYNKAHNNGILPMGYVVCKYFNNGYKKVNHKMGFSNRNSNPNYTKYGILTKIKNPYGVETTFEYDGNRANSDTEGNRLIVASGGLRIKKITEIDVANHYKRYRVFNYGYTPKPELGSDGTVTNSVGIARKIVTIHDYCTQQIKKQFYKNNTIATARFRTWSANPVTQTTYFDGTTTFYSKVTETIYSNKDNEQTKTTYYYANPRESEYISNKRSINISFQIRQESDVRERGLPVCIESYRNDTLIKKINYEYRTVEDSEAANAIFIKKPYQNVVTISMDKFQEHEAEKAKRYSSVDAYMSSSWAMVTDEKIEQYTKKGKVVTKKRYIYNTQRPIFHKNPIRIETLYIAPEKKKKEDYIYPSDTEANQFDDSFGISTLKSMHKYSAPIQIKETFANSSKYTQIKYRNGLPKTIQTRIGNIGNFVEQLKYTYTNGKYREIKEKNGITTTYLWSYNQQYPVAKIKNATTRNIFDAIHISNDWLGRLESADIPNPEDMQKINTLREKLPQAEVTTYTYVPLVGAVSSITDPRGVTTYFENDKNGRLLKSSIQSQNGGKKTLQEVRYHLGTELNEPNEKADPTYPPFASVKIISVDDEILLSSMPKYNFLIGRAQYNKNIKLSAKTEAGSGDFSYNWTVKHCKDMQESKVYEQHNYKTKDIGFKFQKKEENAAIIKIKCVVKDNILKQEKTDFIALIIKNR